MAKLRVHKSIAKQVHEFQLLWGACRRCSMAAFGRKVHVRGFLPCDVLFIGEGPGKTEDALGWPFVGRAGKLLDRWILAALKVRKFRWAIVNLVACRATDHRGGSNRPPTDEEIKACKSRLQVLVSYAKPKIIIYLGSLAAEHQFHGWPFLKLRHPAYVLRQGGVGSREHRIAKRALCEMLASSLFTEVEHGEGQGLGKVRSKPRSKRVVVQARRRHSNVSA